MLVEVQEAGSRAEGIGVVAVMVGGVVAVGIESLSSPSF